jgi:HSP20 family protein
MAGKDVEVRKEAQERERLIRPNCLVCEEESGVITLKLEMPGVTREHLELDVDGNELRITGRRPPAPSQGTYLIRERPQGAFQQAYTLDETIDRGKIGAALAGGVLTITLERKEAEKPRKIAIK